MKTSYIIFGIILAIITLHNYTNYKLLTSLIVMTVGLITALIIFFKEIN